ncbi:DNA repair protein XRCC4-like [Aphomia sociella]
MELTESSTIISKLDVNGQFVYLKIQWKENEFDLFHIKIFDQNNNSWSGRFSKEFAENCRNSIDVDDEEYKINTRQALEGYDSSFSYDFIIQEDGNTAIFHWKKMFDDGTTRRDGSVPIHRDDETESKDCLLDILLNNNRDLKLLIEACHKSNENINKDLNRCKQELEAFVNMKTSLEETLYAKFVQLLNEKKKRIQLLEENFEKLEHL